MTGAGGQTFTLDNAVLVEALREELAAKTYDCVVLRAVLGQTRAELDELKAASQGEPTRTAPG